jgi:hypothetical protein
MRNGVQRNRLQRLKRAREWRPYRAERPVREAPIGPRGRLEIVDQWTNAVVRVIEEQDLTPSDKEQT